MGIFLESIACSQVVECNRVAECSEKIRQITRLAMELSRQAKNSLISERNILRVKTAIVKMKMNGKVLEKSIEVQQMGLVFL